MQHWIPYVWPKGWPNVIFVWFKALWICHFSRHLHLGIILIGAFAMETNKAMNVWTNESFISPSLQLSLRCEICCKCDEECPANKRSHRPNVSTGREISFSLGVSVRVHQGRGFDRKVEKSNETNNSWYIQPKSYMFQGESLWETPPETKLNEKVSKQFLRFSQS